MSIDQILALFSGNFVLLVAKLVLLLIIFLYGIFAAVVLRQVQLMNKVVTEVGFSPVLLTIAVLHFIAVIVVFVLAIILV